MTKELKEIVGVKNIQDNEEVLEKYSQDFSFAPRVRPRAGVSCWAPEHGSRRAP